MWQTAYDALRARNPEYEQITVSDGTAEVAFGGLGNQRAADRYTAVRIQPDRGES